MRPQIFRYVAPHDDIELSKEAVSWKDRWRIVGNPERCWLMKSSGCFSGNSSTRWFFILEDYAWIAELSDSAHGVERNQTMDTSINRRDFIKTGIVAAAVPMIGIAETKADARLGDRPALRMRQVHLDFHTSELIPGIGAEFNKQQWQDALRTGHVNHINVFAKCHHSWSYYPTKIGNTHPNLKFDLLGAQIAASHEIGVFCPIYYTVGWSAHDAETHPEWCVRDKDGTIVASGGLDLNAKPTDVKPHTAWKYLCAAASGSYHANIMRQVEEICHKFPVDGFWFDIYHDHDCHCQFCVARMKQENVDLDDRDAVTRSYISSIKEHMRQVRELVSRFHPNATVYFNSATHPGDTFRFKERLFDLNTQQELEDLPTTWGGYDKLPIEAKYHLGEGSRVVAMSGKFHKSWGEFGGFKSADAIKYEAAAMIANGAACNFGDQLHPCGQMDMETYRNIGEAYAYVDKIEDYGPGGVPYSRLGVWLTLNDEADRGTVNMLLEMHYDFVPANEKNLDRLNTLIIPSQPCLSNAQAAAISEWVKQGGKLLVFESGALDHKKTRFLLDVGAEYLGASEYDCDYTLVKTSFGARVVTTPFLNYSPGLHTKCTTGQPLAVIREPYFSRTYAHYNGHANTPYQLTDSAFPAVVRNGNVVFFAHPLDRLYYANGVRLHRELFKSAIDMAGSEPVLKVTGLPSSGRVSLLHQPTMNRYVAHLLYSPALQRGDCKVIEDFPAISGVTLEIRVAERAAKVRMIPDGETLSFAQENGRVKVAVPKFSMHAAVVLEC
jgi:hypothetical protein